MILDAYSRRVVLGARGLEGKLTRRVADGAGSAASRCRAGASLRRSTVRRQRLCRIVEAARNHPQHGRRTPTTMKAESFEDAEVRRAPLRVPRSGRRAPRSGVFSSRCTKSACIRRWASPPVEFEQNLDAQPAVGGSSGRSLRHGEIDPIGPAEQMRDAELATLRDRLDEFRCFPWRVALPQSPPPLHQPPLCQRAAAGNQKPANGQLCLNYLSHPRGQAQFLTQRAIIPLNSNRL